MNTLNRDPLDDEGENRAVRTFLTQYSCDRATTVGAMLAHMNRSGWRSAAPAFALEGRPEEHLTKAGAQIWIRHLLSLEAQPVAAIPEATIYQIESETAEGRACWLDTTKDRFDDTKKRGFKTRSAYTASSSLPAIPEAGQSVPNLADSARLNVVYHMSMVEPFIAPIATKEQWVASLDRRIASMSADAEKGGA